MDDFEDVKRSRRGLGVIIAVTVLWLLVVAGAVGVVIWLGGRFLGAW